MLAKLPRGVLLGVTLATGAGAGGLVFLLQLLVTLETLVVERIFNQLDVLGVVLVLGFQGIVTARGRTLLDGAVFVHGMVAFLAFDSGVLGVRERHGFLQFAGLTALFLDLHTLGGFDDQIIARCVGSAEHRGRDQTQERGTEQAEQQ